MSDVGEVEEIIEEQSQKIILLNLKMIIKFQITCPFHFESTTTLGIGMGYPCFFAIKKIINSSLT